MRLYKRGRVWWTWIYDANGKRIPQSTKCHDKSAAAIWAAQLERDHADPAAASARDATMSAALDAMLTKKIEEAGAKNLALATVEFYRGKAANLLRYFETTMEVTGAPEGTHVPFYLASMEARHVDSYISFRRKQGATDHTISKELVTLRITLKLAKRAGTFSKDVEAILPVSFAPKYEPVSRVLSVQELQKLLGTMAADRAARLAYAVATSANLGEQNAALREDILDGGALVHVRGTKTEGRDRMVPMVSGFSKTLLAYALRHAQGTGGKLFGPWKKVGRDVYAACDRVGIPHCSTNDWRRTFATWLRASGAAPSLIAACMGHADSRMVERVYGRLRPEELRVLLCKDLGLPVNAVNDCSGVEANSSDSASFFAPIAPFEAPNPAKSNAPGPTRTGGPRIRSPIPVWPNPREERAFPQGRAPAVAQLKQAHRLAGFVSLPAAAQRMGIAYTTLHDWCARGEFASTQQAKAPGRRPLIWIHERDILAFEKSRQRSEATPASMRSAALKP